ncbi:MAG: imidazole glycerol phosphate synthase subunit HisH [Oscillospiraceae bacterium]|nr:imidazole glycerol phosphate synthase subunit HisH [Oscillospiraceae bacterium]
MIAIVDYGVGNLFSLKSSFAAVGARTLVTGDAALLRQADKLVLPGVGAFGDAARKLRQSGLDTLLQEEAARGKPLLGICLGMQLLFTSSLEYGEHSGLDLIPGTVRPIAEVIPEGLKIPHIGWNALELTGAEDPILRRVKPGDCVYFVHSFYARTEDRYISAVTEYGAKLTACVRRDRVWGCQFHPEKSGRVGLRILREFTCLEA